MAQAHQITLANGTQMSWCESGAADGLPVLCLHGYGDSLRSFELMTPHMPSGLRVLAVSHRGHGDSPRPEREEDYTITAFAEDALAFLDAMGIARAVVVGHSMGSFVAQRIAIDAPGRVIGLVLIGSFVTLNGHAGIDEMWKEIVRHMEDPVDPGFIREFQTGTIAMPVDPDYVEVIVSESLKLPARIWRGAMAGMMGQDHTEALAGMNPAHAHRLGRPGCPLRATGGSRALCGDSARPLRHIRGCRPWRAVGSAEAGRGRCRRLRTGAFRALDPRSGAS